MVNVVPPFKIVGGCFVNVKVFPSEYVKGIDNRKITPKIKGILIRKFNFFISFLFEKSSLNKIDSPKDDKIIIDIEANTSSRTNAELT